MTRTALLQIEMPLAAEKSKLPKSVNNRLQTLLDRQDKGKKLTAAERNEAEGLVELAEMLSFLKLKSKRILLKSEQ